MKRRTFLQALIGFPAALSFVPAVEASNKPNQDIAPLNLSPEEWKQRLNDQQFYVLREEGTERAFTSPLNDEKRKGEYHCAGCDLLLFTSEMKYDSGTGWPSFFTVVDGHIETKTDFKLIYPRTEYHCVRCGGHQGHVFNDGPKPTGQRWCNNGVALRFVPA
ncbi:peptide-methionine (R)-S-oxide reductase MsrB [Oceanospirillum linum]|uniref:peptide-methionine (R)-S-oxide reductase n=1 Tax=Oceanospirillum linum TaxID=966 RepID=A0A1T1HD74_OCELI|nr:peptide-methionine (R)-S-oxide reductase MsrB [Oceanospirillum linum]OOV87808.1 peptide-methionine (R)-S-oxide reductase [Oceanospirillum linum]SEG11584.1 peptide-methionine (R)-S-oxide reductase [Oleiphilus messinensis]SMP09262.1 peptide-methionine (R)-S-oxide reductase [Oceanospirillum linum]